MTVNYHTHTTRCRHASGTERDYIETAISRGLTTLGFSDHSPYYFDGDYYSGFRMRREELADYYETLISLRDEYKSKIDIKIGLEAEYYPKYFDKFLALIEPSKLDYLILGQHFLDNETEGRYSAQPTNDPTRLSDYITQLINAIKTGKFTYIAHPDLIAFEGDKTIYTREIGKLCEVSKELDVPLEINMLGLRDHRRYPNSDFWKIVADYDCHVVAGCDAHEPQSIAEPVNVMQTTEFAARFGIIIDDTALKLRKI
jgi:Histidinol phosphatase and related hydrolases of the PHP family